MLGWLFRASNWLPDFVPQLEEDRFGGYCGVAECRAVRPCSVWSVDYLELRKMVKVACFQATALDAHVVVVVGSESLCSILKNYFGELRRSLIWRIRPTSSLFFGRDLSTPRNLITMDRSPPFPSNPISEILSLSYLGNCGRPRLDDLGLKKDRPCDLSSQTWSRIDWRRDSSSEPLLQ